MDKKKSLEYQKKLLSQLICDRTDVYGYFIRERQAVFSDAMSQLYGLPVVVDRFADWMTERGSVGVDSRGEWRDFFAAADGGRKSGSVMVTLKMPVGDFRRYWMRFNRIDDEDGQPFFAVVSLEDFTTITHQIRTKDNDINGLLQAAQRVFPEILTLNMTRGTYRIIQYDAATKMDTPRTGRIDDMVQTRLRGVVPEDRDRFIAAFSLDRLREIFTKNAEESVQLVYRRPGRDGNTYWIETTVMRQKNSADSDMLLVAMSRNVDQQKAEEIRLREQLQLQAEELRLTMMQVGKVVSTYDVATRTLTLPSNVAEQTGMPIAMKNFPEPFIERAGERLPPESAEKYRNFFDEIHRGSPSGSCDFMMPERSGRERWLREEYTTIFDEQKRPIRAVIASSDVTEEHAQARENQRLKKNEFLLRLTAQHSDRTICYYNVKKRMAQVWDSKTCAKCQLPRLCEMTAQEVLSCGDILPESVDELRGIFQAIQNGTPNGAMKMRARTPSGERRWFDLQYSTIYGRDGTPVSAVISHKDITEQYEHEMAFRRYEQAVKFNGEGDLLLLEVDLSADWIEKMSGEMLPVMEREEQIAFSGFAQRMLGEKFLLENRDGATRYFSRESLLELYARGERQLISKWHVRFHDDTLHWLSTEIQLMADPYTGHIKAFIRMADVTKEKQEQEAIQRRAERDGMTGLYNRATAEERVRNLVAAKTHPGILILADLDDLKGINDTFGHKEGDRAITGIADTLRTHFRDSDIVARLGGDEFLVYLPGAAENKDVISLSLTNLLRKLVGISIGAHDERRIHCSIGCAVQSEDTKSYEMLFKQADTALYHVKRSGKNNFAFYEPEMDQADYQFRVQSLRGAKKLETKELLYLLNAIASFYPLMLSINLSTNEYYIVESSGRVLSQAPTFGSLEHFIKMAVEIIHPDDIPAFYEQLSRKALLEAYEQGKTSERHYFRIRRDDSYQWAEVSTIFYTDENGNVCDFTLLRWAAERGCAPERIEGDADIAASEKEAGLSMERYCEFVELVESCMDGNLYIFDIERDLYYISKKSMERFAIPTHMFSDTANVFRTFVHKDDIDWLLEDLGKLAAGEKDSHNLDYRWIGKDGSPIWINCCGRSVRNAEGKPVYMVGCVDEIGKKQRADNNSGLRESSAIRDHADDLLDDDKSGYCLHIGIDQFRTINERFGMDYGDLILRAVAESITSVLGPQQEVYRVVADEYLIISVQGSPEKEGVALYKQIVHNVEAFVEQNGYEAVFTVSGGMVGAKDIKGLSYTQGLKLTQFALGEAKERGRNQLYLFNEEDYRRFIRRRDILSSIKESVSANFKGFEVYYQPIMEKDDAFPYAAEALLRYRMRDGESISPYEFIPIVEESGMIIPIGKWVLNEAMEFCQSMRKKHPMFKVNVNISYVQVMKSPFLDDFLRLLQEHQLSSASIVVELTESGQVEGSPQIQRLWEDLKQGGVSIALDDFGTGYSNLLYISEMTPNVVKLNRSFTVKAMTNPFERMLMNNTIQLVHSLGLKVCVEGVETEEDLAQVHGLGADFIQGYYYSKPCPKQEFISKYC